MFSSVPGTSLGLIFLLAAVDESCKKGNKDITNGKLFTYEQGTCQYWLTELTFHWVIKVVNGSAWKYGKCLLLILVFAQFFILLETNAFEFNLHLVTLGANLSGVSFTIKSTICNP